MWPGQKVQLHIGVFVPVLTISWGVSSLASLNAEQNSESVSMTESVKSRKWFIVIGDIYGNRVNMGSPNAYILSVVLSLR